jgi:hypothetical protein
VEKLEREKESSSKAKPVTDVIQHNRETWSMGKPLAPVPDIMVWRKGKGKKCEMK